MREIEVKVKIKTLEPIIEKLENLGCKIFGPVVQNDIIFSKPNTEDKERNIIRVRQSNNEHLFTLKRDVSDELDCIEKEIKINDPDTMQEIIELLGYSEVVRVNKKRLKCTYKDYEICLDEVENLGLFIEIEKLSDDEAEITRQELLKFLEFLEVDLSHRIWQGYDTMLLEGSVS